MNRFTGTMLFRPIIRLCESLSLFNSRHALTIRNMFLVKTNFFPAALKWVRRLWQENLYIDWLQKKILDKWVRCTVINSNNLFSENFVFKFVVEFYWTLTVLTQQHCNIFPFNNPAFIFIFVITWFFTIVFGVILLLVLAIYALPTI